MHWMAWYNSLAKPSWTPAPATIGLIWEILYPIILISFGFVFVQMFRGKVGCPRLPTRRQESRAVQDGDRVDQVGAGGELMRKSCIGSRGSNHAELDCRRRPGRP